MCDIHTVMSTETTFAIIATVAVLAAAIMPTFLTQASAQGGGITGTDTSCTNPAGKTPGGQQPQCSGGGLTQETENQNPAGKAPPGQNK